MLDSLPIVQQYKFELNIARGLLQRDGYLNNEQYVCKIQDELNKRYGVIEKKKYKLFSRSTYYKVPERYPILDTIEKGKSAIKRDNVKKIFWSKDFNGTEIERQWEKDLGYITKYKIKHGGGVIPDDFRWESYIMHKRKNDENVIIPDAFIFIKTKESYKHFKRKVDAKKLSFEYNVSPNVPDKLNFVIPSAPVL
jgi:hypothetical protein